ncbi:Keratin, Type I Cytoskeletal 26 [Manis pentadactyla]|nr:Keratin, Type I Cytoskeletal 26 [Manis pentadactyla]
MLPPPFPPASILFADAGDSGSTSISGLAKGAAAVREEACRVASRSGRSRSGGGGGFAPGAAVAGLEGVQEGWAYE